MVRVGAIVTDFPAQAASADFKLNALDYNYRNHRSGRRSVCVPERLALGSNGDE